MDSIKETKIVNSQSKKFSLIESLISTLIGFIITLAASPLIYNYCGVKMTFPKMGMVTLLFTIISVIRGYFVRRFFNNNFSFRKPKMSIRETRVTSENKLTYVKIYLNDQLHLYFKKDELLEIQSWLSCVFEWRRFRFERRYFIDFHTKSNGIVDTWYTDCNTWKEILKNIDKSIN